MYQTNGWLCLYKPKNITSAKFLKTISKHFPSTKIGHAGTLDPLAEGILPIGLGEATKLMDLLIGAKKQYQFSLQFGAQTKTGDSESEIIKITNAKVTKEQIEKILPKFTGQITQIPNKFSAIKINGKRAYKLAREDIEFDITPRNIEIYNLKIKNFNYETQVATMVCDCSKGTYIRTLAEDIGFSLNNLGFVIELLRLKVQKFNLTNAIHLSLDTNESSLALLGKNILPIDFVLDDILVINVENNIANRIKCGQKIYFPNMEDGFYAVYYTQILIAIGNISEEVFKVKRVFNL
ncbi:MAG: tRNA pseudouridine(55) synthase TruB [Rickettsiaceae bacterium]|nr:tRNA pseudouridine(55) synthase TruB [Rickettsiaceae bacterium]